ncbi:hypothetical protein [Methylorubrum thiocyanatum]|uniref:hypothetical protein n=1 Tax=Methylorubrum thiocyanatum TaxID=47958 RepID=UPI003F813177
MPYPITPPDGADWSIDVEATDAGVALILVFDLAGVPTRAKLDMDRPDSRKFARAVLAAGGDAMERTFEGARLDAGRG